MIKRTVLSVLSLSLTLPGLAAAEAAPKEERVGVGSGLLVGAAAGGPIGMVLGAAIGGLVGNKIHTEKSGREEYQSRYQAASRDVERLEALLDGSEGDVAELRLALNAQTSRYRDALREMLAAEIYFHTGDTAIDQRTADRLSRLGEVVSLVEDFAIVVEGHADARGDAGYNEQLSADRAAAVRDLLVASGIPADRITAQAAGESQSTAAENDLDSLALERRVQVNLVFPETGRRAARQ